MAFTWKNNSSIGGIAYPAVVNEIIDNITVLNNRISVTIPSVQDGTKGKPLVPPDPKTLMDILDTLQENNYCRAENTAEYTPYSPTNYVSDLVGNNTAVKGSNWAGNHGYQGSDYGSNDGCDTFEGSEKSSDYGDCPSYDHTPSANCTMEDFN